LAARAGAGYVPDTRLTSDPREALEGRTALIALPIAIAPGVPTMKQSLKSRLFGLAVTLSAFAVLIHPMVGKRW
jgi:hypothetical protein